MQSIEINAFGPIKQAKLDLNDVIIFNGEQSSGKSTISKAIYFFRSIPETIFQTFVEEENLEKDIEKKVVVACRNHLMSIFGTTKHFDDFVIKFDYAPGKFINIYKDHNSGHAGVIPSQQLRQGLKDIAEKLEKFKQEKLLVSGERDFSLYKVDRFQFLTGLKREIKELFEEPKKPFFVPAGRSLVSTLSGELRNIDSYSFDSLMQDFVQRIFYLRDTFSKDLEEIVDDKKNLSSAPIDFDRVNLAKQLTEKILQGKYIFENGEERILLDPENYVKIKFASSGQQEILWILLLLFLEMLDNEPSFGVFEEPEAHIYPVTQYEVVKILSLFVSNSINQAIVTTHSPYIMAAINNMLMACQAGEKHSDEAQEVLPKLLWLDKRRVSAFFVAQGLITDMFDQETGIIDTQYIDSVSDMINDDFDKLLAMVE